MALQFFKTAGKEIKNSEFHKKLAEAAFQAICPDSQEAEDEDENSPQDQFLTSYRAAFKAGLGRLSLFLIQSGKPLLASDSNSSRRLTRITTITCFA